MQKEGAPAVVIIFLKKLNLIFDLKPFILLLKTQKRISIKSKLLLFTQRYFHEF
jgi:hypothetical protein